MKVVSVLLTVLVVSNVWAGAAGARSNRWVEVWCDSDVMNGDGAEITVRIENGQTIAGADDRIGKILDASALEPGNKEATTTAYNANAGDLGYLFTGIWSVLTGVAIVGRELLPAWMGWVGIVVGVGLIIGSAEFLGRDEEDGWALAGAVVPILYIAWSLWLLAMGIALII